VMIETGSIQFKYKGSSLSGYPRSVTVKFLCKRKLTPTARLLEVDPRPTGGVKGTGVKGSLTLTGKGGRTGKR
jgi:hypothetical protein